MRLSIIDFAGRYTGESFRDALEAATERAQRADASGRFERIWYSEHHNMANIVSSTPPVLIGHIAAKTEKIRLGSGGVMLPNHSPLVVAEQFGTLAELHPDRIDIGVGRAPGTDQTTLRDALRRDLRASDRFPQDVAELREYLAGNDPVPGVFAYPGAGTNVPVYILGSSLFGAKLAAQLGLPYSFASHFAPPALKQAVAAYRDEYRPSEQHPEPYVIAAANAVGAGTREEAEQIHRAMLRERLQMMVGQNPQVRGHKFTDEELDTLLEAPVGQQVQGMYTYTAVGTADDLRDYFEKFVKESGADEVMVSPHGTAAQQLAAIDVLAQV